MPPNTCTTEALRRAKRITELQLAAAIDAAVTGWSRRPFPFSAYDALDLTTLLSIEADAVLAVASDGMADHEKRAGVCAAILRAVPVRVNS